jgi:xanthine dehydrogenase accessory factor
LAASSFTPAGVGTRVGTDLVDLAHRLTNSGEAYCLATVVWRRGPSSAKEGYKALITENEKVHGWVAGACTEPLMVRQARKAMRDGQPRLMLIGDPEDIDVRARDGLLTFPQTCASEGALEVFVEPVIPSPHLAIIGRSPVVGVMAEMGRALGWRTVIVDDEGESGPDDSAADRVVKSLDLAEAGVRGGSFVVVATQGHYDEDALQRALETDAAYVGLVSSRKRAKSVLDYLRESGVSEEALARVRAPAGLDLGKVRHEEIAVGVIAELVQLRAAGEVDQPSGTRAEEPAQEHREISTGDGSRPEAAESSISKPAEAEAAASDPAPDGASNEPVGAPEPEEAIDPVCGMIVEVASARYKSDLEGNTYYFCCPACRKKFQANPQEYLDKVKQGGMT